MSQGSPGQAISIWEQLRSIPEDLLQKIDRKPQNLREALELAKEIDKTLDTESQLWLIDYLQHSYWQNQQQMAIIQTLEQARKYLLSYAQPRLVWEVTLLEMMNR